MGYKIKNFTTVIKAVTKFADKKSRLLLYINIILLGIMGALSPLISWIYSLLINSLSESFHIILLIAIGYILIQFFQDIIELVSNHLSLKIEYLVENNVIESINDKLSTIQLEEMENPETYDLIDRSLSEIATGITSFVQDILSFFQPIISVITYSIILVHLNLWYPVLIVIPSIPFFYISLLQGKEKYKQRTIQNREKRQSDYIKNVMTDRRYAKEIKLFGLTDYITNKFTSVNQKLNNEQIKLNIKQSVRMFIINVLRNIALGICVFLCTYDIIYHHRPLGDIYIVISAVNAVVSNISNLIVQSTAINTIFFYFNDWTKLNGLSDEKKGTMRETIMSWDITFDNVSFQYPNSLSLALQNVSLTINQGERIAIVGENGSGKTTFTNLLLGNYKPTSGSIKIGEVLINDCLDEFREHVSCTYQNFIKYQLSMLDNLKAGNFGDEIDIKECTRFGILELAHSLPNGFETQLGQLESDSYELSGGEWQKLAINRALAKRNIKLIVLDEPTSAVDPITENEIYKEFTNITKGKTAIIVSHRLSTTKLCDNIVVFDCGHVIEVGNHDELMKLQGKYYKMFSTQQSLYK